MQIDHRLDVSPGKGISCFPGRGGEKSDIGNDCKMTSDVIAISYEIFLQGICGLRITFISITRYVFREHTKWERERYYILPKFTPKYNVKIKINARG